MRIDIADDPGTFDDETSFAARARPVLRAHRVATSVISTWLSGWIAGKPLPPTKWFLVVVDGQVVAAAIHANGQNVVISPLDDDIRGRVTVELAELLVTMGDPVPGVSARDIDAQAFSDAWLSRASATSRLSMADVVYEIRHPPAGPDVEGGGRSAIPDDGPLLTRWMAGFVTEALHEVVTDDPDTAAAQRVARGGLYLWERNGEPVCMAGLNGPADGVARIGPVYTPPQFRRHGFGAALTAYVTRTAMDQGADLVMLFADRANPASNRVYARLGFEQAGTSVMLAFDPA